MKASFTRPLFLLLLFSSGLAYGHEMRPATLDITENTENQFSVVWKIPSQGNRELNITPVFPETCVSSELASSYLAETTTTRLTLNCDLRVGVIVIQGLQATLTDVFINIHYLDGAPKTALIRGSEPTYNLGQAQTSAFAYFRLGIDHLLSGFDHLLFLATLILLFTSAGVLIKAVTAFTLAHSLTLALVILGSMKLPPAPVEACIALSIVFTARELLIKTPSLTRRYPWLITFLFGLLHGLGFAGAFSNFGLSGSNLWLGLGLFNLGIEAAQILIILTVLGLLYCLKNTPITLKSTSASVSAWLIGGTATFWFLDRLTPLF